MSIKHILRFVKNEFIYGGHLFALGAFSVVFMSAILLNVTVTIDFLVVIYLTFYAIYLNDHYIDAEKDFLINAQRASYLKKNKIVYLLLFISILISLSLLYYFGSVYGMFLGLIIFFLGLLYSKYFKKITKKIVIFKNFFVASVWSILVLYLFMYYSYIFSVEMILFAFFIFLRIFIVQIFLDIRDINGDKRENLLTIPVLFGKRKSINVIIYLNILSILFLFYCIYLNIFSKILFFLALIVPYNFYYVNCLNIKNDNSPYILASTEPIALFVFILIGKFLL